MPNPGKGAATGERLSVTACPICGGRMMVTETRTVVHGLRRRRRCMDRECKGRLSTIEIIVPSGRPNHRALALVPIGDLEIIHALVTSHIEARHASLDGDLPDDASTEADAKGQVT